MSAGSAGTRQADNNMRPARCSPSSAGLHAVLVAFVLISLFDSVGAESQDAPTEADSLVAVTWAADALPGTPGPRVPARRRLRPDGRGPGVAAPGRRRRGAHHRLDAARPDAPGGAAAEADGDWQIDRKTEASNQLWPVYQARQERLANPGREVGAVAWFAADPRQHHHGDPAAQPASAARGSPRTIIVSTLAGTITLLLFAIHQLRNPLSGGAKGRRGAHLGAGNWADRARGPPGGDARRGRGGLRAAGGDGLARAPVVAPTAARDLAACTILQAENATRGAPTTLRLLSLPGGADETAHQGRGALINAMGYSAAQGAVYGVADGTAAAATSTARTRCGSTRRARSPTSASVPRRPAPSGVELVTGATGGRDRRNRWYVRQQQRSVQAVDGQPGERDFVRVVHRRRCGPCRSPSAVDDFAYDPADGLALRRLDDGARRQLGGHARPGHGKVAVVPGLRFPDGRRTARSSSARRGLRHGEPRRPPQHHLPPGRATALLGRRGRDRAASVSGDAAGCSPRQRPLRPPAAASAHDPDD